MAKTDIEKVPQSSHKKREDPLSESTKEILNKRKESRGEAPKLLRCFLKILQIVINIMIL